MMSLPTWNLDDLYNHIKDPTIDQDIEILNNLVNTFVKDFHGLSHWNEKLLYDSLVMYEQIHNTMSKLRSYSSLVFYANMEEENLIFYRRIDDVMCQIEKKIIFYSLAINAMDEAHLTAMIIKTPILHPYTHWFQELRRQKPHQLDAINEQLLLEKNLVAQQAWVNLYDQVLESTTFFLENEPVTLEQLTSSMSHHDTIIRQKSAFALSKGLKNNLMIFTSVFNAVVKNNQIDDAWRHFPTCDASRHLANSIEPSVVQTLYETVVSWYPRLSHRYYALKAQLLKKNHIEYWDRNAPIVASNIDGVSHIPFEEAKNIILKAYKRFCPIMAKNAELFFKNQWIDAQVRPKKVSGAFSHSCCSKIHPYILMSYQSKPRDVMTLAHELGHGVHQYLCQDLGPLLSSTPLTFAETASVFGEMLTFQYLLETTTKPQDKIQLLAMKIDDMMNTVIRQIAFYDFERQAHELASNARSLTQDDLNSIWRRTQQKALGDAVYLDPVVDCYWSYISHFIHAPFYVYAYAFGDCLVNSLYVLYEQKKIENFEEKYICLLKAGGSLPYTKMLQPFGLNPKDKKFWENGLSFIEQMINELEHLCSVHFL
jgi:oligoendopeptidase F